jgi:hypothetical protein
MESQENVNLAQADQARLEALDQSAKQGSESVTRTAFVY